MPLTRPSCSIPERKSFIPMIGLVLAVEFIGQDHGVELLDQKAITILVG